MTPSRPAPPGPGERTRAHGGPQRSLPVLLVGALALLALGAVLGRATAPAAPPTEDPEETPPETVAPGPTRLEAGVPVGYAHTEAGAVAAAAQYVATLDGELVLIEDEREAVLDAIAAEEAREELAATVGEGSTLIVEGLDLTPEVVRDPAFVVRPVPAGYRLVSYDGSEATVEIWGTAVFFAEGRHALSDEWSTVTVELRWERDDWRLSSTQSDEGPTPPDTPTPPDPGLGERINAFNSFVHLPPPE